MRLARGRSWEESARMSFLSASGPNLLSKSMAVEGCGWIDTLMIRGRIGLASSLTL